MYPPSRSLVLLNQVSSYANQMTRLCIPVASESAGRGQRHRPDLHVELSQQGSADQCEDRARIRRELSDHASTPQASSTELRQNQFQGCRHIPPTSAVLEKSSASDVRIRERMRIRR